MTETAPFEAFMRNYQNMVFSTAMRLTGNPSEAEDISQEVFLKAFERFGDLRDNPRAPGWLKTVAINLSLNHLTRHRARWTLFTDYFRRGESGEGPEMEFEAPDNVEEDLARAERRQAVDQALRKLPDAQRVPLVLYHVEGLKYEEIAAKLGVSLGKVKTDIFRGREVLRRRLSTAIGRDAIGHS